MLLTFKNEIKEGIQLIQSNYKNLDDNLQHDEYAFLYWLLSKIYSIDETEIPDYITEYNDKGIDAFVYFEENKELYIIQAKYYDIESKPKVNDVSDFLLRPLTFLNANNYKKSPQLQKIYNKIKDDSQAKIELHFYSTSKNYSDDIEKEIKEFNVRNRSSKCNLKAAFFPLSEIYKKFYGKGYKESKNLEFKLRTINKGTFASLKDDYGIQGLRCEAYYIIAPITEIYRLKKEADFKNYPLFEANVREYLGDSVVNKKIVETLSDQQSMNNFLFYNNGITIIADKILKSETTANGALLPFKNPQVVNGCQTVNSIFDVLDRYNENELNKFNGVFVMVKALVISSENEEDKKFYKQVVKFTNSQNAVPDKVFATDEQPMFFRLQEELKERGILLKVKQSDKYKFSNMSTAEKNTLIAKASEYASHVGYTEKLTQKDIEIDFDKFLQIMLTFQTDAQTGYQKKSHVLKRDTTIFKNFTLKLIDILSANNMVYIYFYHKKLLTLQKEKLTCNANYMLSFVTYLFKKNASSSSLNDFATNLFAKDTNEIETITSFLSALSSYYFEDQIKKGLEYNKIIKSKYDTEVIDSGFSIIKNIFKPFNEAYDFLNKKYF